ncbi:MAG TPA: hypothetical protein DCZ61_06785 [Lachnospiraceae bacterium]|nr:hypothetical protein [Lachnospiraceae bacterium]
MTPDVNTVLIDMPTDIKSYVISDRDDFFTIVINSRLSYAAQLIAYQHELRHIINGDCDRDVTADLIEIFAHKSKM